MLTQAIGDLLPTAVGVALSPIPIIAVILMLGTPKGRGNGLAFALGWIVGLVVVSIVVLLVAGGADDPDSGASDGVNTFQLVLGAVFITMGLRQWRSRPRKGEEPVMPKWMATIDGFTPGKSAVLGLLLSAINPKNLALTAAAAATIAQTPGLSGTDEAIAVAVFVVIASITVVGPVIIYLVAREKSAAFLGSLNHFMAEHNAVIMMVLLLVIGAKLLGQGMGGLAA